MVEEYLGSQDDAIEGFNQPKTWKLAPKNTFDPPAAKKDRFGNLVTDKKGLEDLYLETRAERTSPLSVRDRYFLVCFGLSVIGFQVVNTIKGKKIN